MRPRTFLVALLALTLCAPAAAQERRKPRVTDPEEATGDEVAPSSPSSAKKKRKHATSMEDDGGGSSSSEDAPPPKKKSNFGDDEAAPAKKSAPAEDEEVPPPPARKVKPSDEGEGEGGDEDAPRASRRRSSDDEGSSDDEDGGSRSRRKTTTAEEDLSEEVEAAEAERLAADDEPGNGIAAELTLGGLWLSGSTGAASSHFMAGLIVSYQLGRAAFDPETEFLHENLLLELSYQASATGTSVGTEQVRVNSGVHYLTLDVLFGYPLPPVLFYAKIGPSLVVMPVTYDVQGAATSFTGVKAGLVYGLGVRSNWYFHRFAGFAWRVEFVGYRRGYLDDLMLTVGVGVCF